MGGPIDGTQPYDVRKDFPVALDARRRSRPGRLAATRPHLHATDLPLGAPLNQRLRTASVDDAGRYFGRRASWDADAMVEKCPSFESLRSLVDGTLEASQLDAVTNHLEVCADCDEQVARLEQLFPRLDVARLSDPASPRDIGSVVDRVLRKLSAQGECLGRPSHFRFGSNL